jgi:Ca2+-binding EF-hand superfamily protein/tRNA A-37 threonylcarbamoyl transferase component Bud32
MTIAVFSGDELHILKKIWEDLSERSDESDFIGIDKETFLKYIPVNGLLGERMFEKFDVDKTNRINFDNFLHGLSMLCLGTLSEQTTFLFDICDINGNGLILKQDLITILNYIPKEFLCNYTSLRTRLRARTFSRTRSKSISPSNLSNSSDNIVGFMEYTNICVCEDAFVHNNDFLNFEDFSIWLKYTPAILGYLKSIIPCMAEDNLVTSDDKPQLWKKGEKTGFMIKRYYLLCGHCLYYYYSRTQSRPTGVIFLTGSIIQHVEDAEMKAKGYFGFEITQQNLCTGEYHHHEKRIYYCTNQQDCNKWVNNLQILSEVIPFNEEYKIGKKIGIGAFSEVFECTYIETGEIYAVKIICKEIFKNVEKSHITNEIAILKLVDHPNVIHLKYTYESRTHIYIVTELIRDGDFLEYIVGKPRFTEDCLRPILKQLLEATAYLHEYGIVHCDIKPENILYDKATGNIIKLTDFGLSRMIFSNQKIDEACGTIQYIAPETLRNGEGYGMESDLWSIGIVMYLLLEGKLPFNSEDNSQVVKQILELEPTIKDFLSENAKDLLMKLLVKNPKNRITAKDALIHPFFN